jgi:2-succinyl-5-enolpyruvyl-6-hydroxy-3-cyclohexene-1-carboxylate synthase
LWPDPTRTADLHLSCYPAAFASAVMASAGESAGDHQLRRWQKASGKIEAMLKDVCHRTDPLTELSLVFALGAAGVGSGFFLASSLPARDMDWFAVPGGPLHVAANRGASGIDGTIASAAGFAQAHGSRVTALVGDLAALHDLNSLALVARLSPPLTVVIVNNKGGRIFEQLPVAQHTALMDQFFIAAHKLTFEGAADMFGLDYTSVDNVKSLAGTLELAGESAGPAIIEAVVDPDAGRTVRSHVFNLTRQNLKRS